MVSVHQDISVNDENCHASNVYTKTFTIIDTSTVLSFKSCGCKQEICHEEAHCRLVDAVEHVEPNECQLEFAKRSVDQGLPKFHLRPFSPFHTPAIQLRNGQRYFITDILV